MKRNHHHGWTIHDGNPAASILAPRHWNNEANSSLATSGSQWPRVTVESSSTPEVPARRPSILVPVDGEQFSEHALPHAIGIARRWGAEVRVVTVYSPFKSSSGLNRHYYDSNLDAFFRRRQRTYLDVLFNRLARITSVPIRPIFIQGSPVAVSLRNAAKGADLVVMATRGRGRLGRFLFGSVAATLVHQLSLPVLLIRGYHAPADLTGDPLMQHILTPLDGSATAEAVLEPAVALGALRDAHHTLIRVISPSTGPLWEMASGSERPGSIAQQPAAADYLRHVARRLSRRSIRVQSRIVHDDQPVGKAILDYARHNDVDLIALSMRNRVGLASVFRRSVSDEVIRGADVPVLVYPPGNGEVGYGQRLGNARRGLDLGDTSP